MGVMLAVVSIFLIFIGTINIITDDELHIKSIYLTTLGTVLLLISILICYIFD